MIDLIYQCIKDLGDSAVFQKTITETDVYMYAGVSGDINPAHINESFMKDSIFEGRIVHGMLTAGLISAVLGTQYLGQELKFKAPVKFGDTIEAKVTVTEKIDNKNRIICDTTCTNQDGVIVLTGQATVMPPKKA